MNSQCDSYRQLADKCRIMAARAEMAMDAYESAADFFGSIGAESAVAHCLRAADTCIDLVAQYLADIRGPATSTGATAYEPE